MTSEHRHAGFTLPGLLVPVVAFGMLLAAAFPALQQGREAARRSTCAHQMRQIGVAMIKHHLAHGTYPAGLKAFLSGRPSLDWDGPDGRFSLRRDRTTNYTSRALGNQTSSFRSAHRGGGNFMFADGAVHFVADSIDLRIYRALSSIRGSEDFDAP